MIIAQASLQIFNQLSALAGQLSATQYAQSLPLLGKSSIGQHVRHVLEFYQCLQQATTGHEAALVVNYDARQHNSLLEQKGQALTCLQSLEQWLQSPLPAAALTLEVCYGTEAPEQARAASSLHRELAYCVEHAIHHMAIVKIACRQYFPEVQLAADFGVASSTIRYQNRLAAK